MSNRKSGVKKTVGGKVSLFGNFGTHNIGNECTLRAILHNIRSFLPESEVLCICPNPGDVYLRHRVEAVPMNSRPGETSPKYQATRGRGVIPRRLYRNLFMAVSEFREWIRALRILRGQDRLIMTGTGMLTDQGEGPRGLPYEIFKWSLAAKFRGTKIFFVSVGVEPIRRRLARMFIVSSLRLAEFVSFRDQQSRTALKDIGFTGKASVFPDLAFSLPMSLIPEPRDHRNRCPAIGIGLFDYCGRESGLGDSGRYRGYLEKISSFATLLTERGHPVRILIGDLQYDNAVRTDLRHLLESRGLPYEESGITDEPVWTIEELILQIEKTDIVVASRFHNVLIALMLGKQVISISYNEKNDALMTEAGLGDYCRPIADFTVPWLVERLASIEGEGGNLRIRINTMTAKYRRSLQTQYHMIFSASGDRAV